MKQLLTINCVSCRHVASVKSDQLDAGFAALATTLAEHVRTEHPEWGEQGAQAAHEYVYAKAEEYGWVQPDPEREKAVQRQRQRALHLDKARAELTDQGGQGLPPEWGGTSGVQALSNAHPLLAGNLIVQAFLAEWHQYRTAAENAPSPNADYHRWQGHMEARRQLADRLGVIL